ncbi:hypothetical protein H7E67_09650 [Clostridium gasigenes]|uniref:hypothetical protein n=1 Tax=Clostridium gasigenes TaxID=94869 RepID=UPI0016248756|nr:hypothetical protein [Clostridium gasigenes]MBB6623694.1 hypothetical protein [Clostridium gasigenes]MBU3088826.1 hypothetical protein [Clostridium gasigenes]
MKKIIGILKILIFIFTFFITITKLFALKVYWASAIGNFDYLNKLSITNEQKIEIIKIWPKYMGYLNLLSFSFGLIVVSLIIYNYLSDSMKFKFITYFSFSSMGLLTIFTSLISNKKGFLINIIIGSLIFIIGIILYFLDQYSETTTYYKKKNKSKIVSILLTVIFPGLGHLYLDNKQKGILLSIICLILFITSIKFEILSFLFLPLYVYAIVSIIGTYSFSNDET